ncbi:hypothetical protein Syun_013667 [Stephania yunnanensis]|uniref:LisH domain-containing protein n=1 Tax=Stephania yunnanensis TaxID=152371 RepID=A0AAP0JI13_9MAGN
MMDVEKSSLCNCVVNFLLEENYLLSAFELLHELLEDGRDAQAMRLKDFFSNPSQFPPDQISRFNTLRVADPQSLLEEKEIIEEKLAISEYELRLAQEDILRLKTELEKKMKSLGVELNGLSIDSADEGPTVHMGRKDISFSDLGPLKDNERRDLNCAVKEYLLLAGYRLTAMTFYEEVAEQNLDVWQNSPACVPDALRHYYYQYLSSTALAAEEKLYMLKENESLQKENTSLNLERESLIKSKDLADGQIMALSKSTETLQKDLKEREVEVQDLKQALEVHRKELNDRRSEITSLKPRLEGSQSSRVWASGDAELVSSQSIETYKAKIKSLQEEIERLKTKNSSGSSPGEVVGYEDEDSQNEEKVVEILEDKAVMSNESHNLDFGSSVLNGVLEKTQNFKDNLDVREVPYGQRSSSIGTVENSESTRKDDSGPLAEDTLVDSKSDKQENELICKNMGLETIQILSDALPKIVPYVLINHREACINLAKNVGQMRTETELLPQCWEQLLPTYFGLAIHLLKSVGLCSELHVHSSECATDKHPNRASVCKINHTYEERRLLVAKSCGELAEFVRPEIRDSLILSIVQQLIEDPATVVREAAAHNLALLLPLFPNVDKFYKVEELMFQLVCDPSGVVVETSLKELVPAVTRWGNKLDHMLQTLLSHILGSAQRCSPLSGVQGSVESHLRVLGERERWNIDVLLRMLIELLPFVHQKVVETCPFPSVTTKPGEELFSTSLLELYAGGHVEWPIFDWMHINCFIGLIQLACLLPHKEDNLRHRLTKFLLAVSKCFGDDYLTHIMLPIFLIAVGDTADLEFFPSAMHQTIRGLRPRTAVAEKLSIMCILPLLLAGILGASSRNDLLADYLRKLLVQGSTKESWPADCSTETINAVRFLCTFDEHQGIVFNILWEMVVSSNANMKMGAANLLKVVVPCVDSKVVSTHVLPALVTLGSDQNLNVKYASIDAFGAIVDKIRVQMDAFLEDGSHEATIAVIRALLVAVPHTTDRLRDYILHFRKCTSPPGSNVMRRRERADAFCESIRALDATEYFVATDLPPTSVREFLLPAIQNLLKDPDSLDPAHKEALEIIMKERSGGTFETITKVMGMGSHLGIASSVSSLFGEGGLLGKKDITNPPPEPVEPENAAAQPPVEDTRAIQNREGFDEVINRFFEVDLLRITSMDELESSEKSLMDTLTRVLQRKKYLMSNHLSSYDPSNLQMYLDSQEAMPPPFDNGEVYWTPDSAHSPTANMLVGSDSFPLRDDASAIQNALELEKKLLRALLAIDLLEIKQGAISKVNSNMILRMTDPWLNSPRFSSHSIHHWSNVQEMDMDLEEDDKSKIFKGKKVLIENSVPSSMEGDPFHFLNHSVSYDQLYKDLVADAAEDQEDMKGCCVDMEQDWESFLNIEKLN